MIACVAYCATVLTAGIGVPPLLLSVAVLNLLVVIWLIWMQPEYGLRFVAWVLRRKAAKAS